MYPVQPQQFPGQPQFAAPVSGPVEITFVSDSTTVRTLSRVTALMNWRLPALWIIVAVLPVFLLVRGIFRVLSNDADAEVDPGEVFGAFFVVLGFELVVLVLLTGWTMVFGNSNVRRYAASGTPMWARYTHDALHLRLAHSPDIHLPYTSIKRLSVYKDVVYLRKNDGKGFALPRALASDPALTLMQQAGVRI